jgi:hypothetical protein
VRAEVEHLDDAGVVDRCNRLRLGQEAHPLLGVRVLACKDHFQGDDAVEALLPGLVDDAPAAPAQFLQDLVARRHRCGRRRWIGWTESLVRQGHCAEVQVAALDGLFHGELNGERFGQVGEPSVVFAWGRRFAEFLTQQHLVQDQVQNRLAVASQGRLLRQVGFRQHTVAAPPTRLLI